MSWDKALDDIAQRLVEIRDQHGGNAFAFAGGGGQGNHLGGAYSQQLLAVMKSFFSYNALGQEKTGDFWINGRLFGSQTCHTTEDVEHADYVLFIGTNPFQAHGIPNARDTLKHIKKDPERTMVVVDPRVTETAKMADIHLQLRPGSDSWLMSALLAIIVRDNLHDRNFLAKHCRDFDQVEQVLRNIPIADYAVQADVPLEVLEQVADGYASAKRACLRIDLGIQQTLNTTLNGYLEKLLYLVTGNFGIKGGNNLHSFIIPVIGHTDERNPKYRRTVHHGMFPIAGIYPPNILPDEILHEGEDRVRAVFVDSSNPAVTWTNSDAYERAFSSLELLVVVDVAMTETARLAHYVLPAASQFEKWEATGFNLEFPVNGFHLRHPLFPVKEGTLPEPEIYTRLLEKMGAIPDRFPKLERIARLEPEFTHYGAYLAGFAATIARNPKLAPFAASILYRTLGKALPNDAAAAAPMLALSIIYAQKHYKAVKRAGHAGNRLTLGSNLFKAILAGRSGVIISEHQFRDLWDFIAHKDRRIHLAIPEMLNELTSLTPRTRSEDYPFVLMAGERRSYNANQIYRDPAWRKMDPHGSMRMHPQDAETLALTDGDRAQCRSEHGTIEVVIEVDDSVRTGMVTLPHGYGMRYQDSAPIGPELNRLTDGHHCDPLSKTPYHKHVPVQIEKIAAVEAV
ncbi:molybdopterin-dependent oxidoreductase [Alcanivorax sp. IL1]|uniref:molybdopterin-dependent oxidoreductase n=1 Tax=Alcanivorax sp. IL1 TaxID=3396308 RepID=UPI0039C12700